MTNKQTGFAPIFLILSLLAAIGLGVYLVQTRTNLFPRAVSPGADYAVSCAPNKNTVQVNELVVWRVEITGGSTPYIIEWRGSDGFDFGGPTASAPQSQEFTYKTAGTKTAKVFVTSAGVTATADCSPSVVVTDTSVPTPTPTPTPTASTTPTSTPTISTPPSTPAPTPTPTTSTPRPSTPQEIQPLVGGRPAVIVPSGGDVSKVISCVNIQLGLQNPVTAPEKNNATLVYWDTHINSKQQLSNAAAACNASLLNPTNFTSAGIEGLVQSVTGAPSSDSDGSKYRSIIVDGVCTQQKIEEYRSNGIKISVDTDCNEPQLGYKVNAPFEHDVNNQRVTTLTSGIGDGGEANAPVLAQCSDTIDNDADGLIDAADPQCHTDGNASNPASYNPNGPSEAGGGGGGSPPRDTSFTTCYRIAESQADLAGQPCNPYTIEPVLVNFQLKDDSPGQKQIWVRFEGFQNGQPKTQDEHIPIELLAKDPTVSGVDCTLDLSSKNLKVTVTGERLGTDQGSLTANKTLLDILSWKDSQAVGILRNPNVPVDTGQKFSITLTRKDGKVLPEQICRVDTGLISLGARVFCREEGKFDVDNVKVALVSEDKSKVEETVTIDKEGIIGNLKTRLQSGKKYVLSIKAPNSLRRNAIFTASNGTSVVTDSDGGPFILPIGDIAPLIKQDGKINALDRAELTRQWRVLGTAKNTQTGDFNRDTKVNSIDWACMRYDFDESDDPIPDSVPISTPSPSASPITQIPVLPQQASFNLSLGSSSPVQVGNEVQVKVNVRSDTDNANLFAAKISFPQNLLNVERIENTGSIVTTFAEKFFDNSSGQISIVGGTPNPGVKTNGSDSLFATIFFKAIAPGSAALNFGSDSAIFRNSDNQNILNSKNGLTLTINQ